MKRFELSTLSLARRCSTTELHPHGRRSTDRSITFPACPIARDSVNHQSSKKGGRSAQELLVGLRTFGPSQKTKGFDEHQKIQQWTRIPYVIKVVAKFSPAVLD
jgi:hypothetical protein